MRFVLQTPLDVDLKKHVFFHFQNCTGHLLEAVQERLHSQRQRRTASMCSVQQVNGSLYSSPPLIKDSGVEVYQTAPLM